MDDHNINDEWFEHHQMPQNMPLADTAWNDMLAKLDKEMPVDSAMIYTGKQKLLQHKKLYLIILLLLLLNINHTRENRSTQHVISTDLKALVKDEKISNQQPGEGLTDKLSPAIQQNGITSNNLKNKRAIVKKKTSNNDPALTTARTQTQKEIGTITEERKAALQDTGTVFIKNENVVLNNKAPDVKKMQPAVVKPIDSSQNSNEDENKNKLNVQAGLQWTLALPIAGTQNYFAGPSASSQAWRVLLPGAWISFKADKSMLLAEVNPFATAAFNPKSFYTNTAVNGQMLQEINKSLTKVFGITGAISYQYNIKNNWWAGGGLQASFWKKGVAVLTVKEHDNSTNVTASYSDAYVLNKDDWQYFSKFQLYPHAQLMYSSTRYQMGLRSGATFTPLAKEKGAKNLLFTEVFFRLPLISNNKH